MVLYFNALLYNDRATLSSAYVKIGLIALFLSGGRHSYLLINIIFMLCLIQLVVILMLPSLELFFLLF